MPKKTVSSTEFQTRAGQYVEEAAKNPIFITRYNRPLRVLVDIEEYERLKAADRPRSYYPHELPEEWKQELDKGFQGPRRPELDYLLEEE